MLPGVVCDLVYCHMYWGCLRLGCRGCLAKFNGNFVYLLCLAITAW